MLEPEKFTIFFQKAVSLITSNERSSFDNSLVMRFINLMTQRLDVPQLRKEISQLVSIRVWKNLSFDPSPLIIENEPLQKLWKSAQKKIKKESKNKPNLFSYFDFIFTTVVDFLVSLNTKNQDLDYSKSILELLVSLLSQLPTRRFINTLLKNLNIYSLVRLSLYYDDLRDLLDLLDYYMYFPFDDFSGLQVDYEREIFTNNLKELRSTAYDMFPEKLKLLSYSNLEALSDSANLKEHLSELNDKELFEFSNALKIRTNYPNDVIVVDRKLMTQFILSKYSSRKTISEIVDGFDVLPNETIFQSNTNLQKYQLGLQYLSTTDFLIRSFQLYRAEHFFNIKTELEDALKRVDPLTVVTHSEEEEEIKLLELQGKSQRVSKLSNSVSVLEIKPPNVLESSLQAKLEISLDRRDWYGTSKDDILFLAQLGTPIPGSSKAYERLGVFQLKAVRVAETFDWKDRPIRNSDRQSTKVRKINVWLNDYNSHDASIGKLNAVLKRSKKDYSFYSVLSTVKKILLSINLGNDIGQQMDIPDWLMDVFLGFGSPDSVSNSLETENIDFLDTFIDLDHLNETFPQTSSDISNGPFLLDNKNVAHSYVQKSNNPYKKQKINFLRYTQNQVKAIVSAVHPGLTLIEAPPGTGKTDVTAQILKLLNKNFPEQRALVVTKNSSVLDKILEKINAKGGINDKHLLRLGYSKDTNKLGRVESYLDSRSELLNKVDTLATSMGFTGVAYGDSCQTAEVFYERYVLPAWNKFKDSNSQFPFEAFFSDLSEDEIDPETCFSYIESLFDQIKSIRPYEIIRGKQKRSDYMLSHDARIICMTANYATMNLLDIVTKLKLKFDTIIFEEAGQLTELETCLPLLFSSTALEIDTLKRVILLGDLHQTGPIVKSEILKNSKLDQSLFQRWSRLGVPIIELDTQFNTRPEIASIYSSRYQPALKSEYISESKINPGFLYTTQFLDIGDFQSNGETSPIPFFYQNLGEAEYAVALYQYMRLLNYPSSEITILSAYAGQKQLIGDVLMKRCSNNIFGIPNVATIDEFQGSRSPYIILSLVRTKSVGYLNDTRRLTSGLSSATQGLYVLYRKELFDQMLNESFNIDLSDENLMVVPGEMYGITSNENREGVSMVGLEHFGQYVYEMTQTRMEYENSQVATVDTTN